MTQNILLMRSWKRRKRKETSVGNLLRFLLKKILVRINSKRTNFICTTLKLIPLRIALRGKIRHSEPICSVPVSVSGLGAIHKWDFKQLLRFMSIQCCRFIS